MKTLAKKNRSNNLPNKDLCVFSFETNLLSEELKGNFDDDDVDFPIALVSYNKNCDCFEHDREYTLSLIQRMMNNLFFGS